MTTKAKTQILKTLLNLKNSQNKVKLSSYFVERKLIEKGKGCLSAARIIRKLREEGFLKYPDPRSNNHMYIIKLSAGKIKKYLKNEEKKRKSAKKKK